MLTRRQINILTYLENYKTWVSGEQLTEHFHIDRKTVQSELKQIHEELGDGCNIESSRKGYQLTTFTPDVRKTVYEQIAFYGGRNCLGVRPSALALYLMLLKDYASMQQLADLFYLSKTAVSIEIETLKRWIERYDGLQLEVSGNRGIRIVGAEQRKRIYCAKFGTRQTFNSMPIGAEIIIFYEEKLQKVEQILQQEFTSYGLIVTGEEFNKNCRYIAICILRTRMGFAPPDEPAIEERRYTQFVRRIDRRIEQELGYKANETEIYCFASMLEEENVLDERNAAPFVQEQQAWTGMMHLEHRLRKILAIPTEPIFTSREEMTQMISRLLVRSEGGNVAINHYNEEIICRYPLETHLMNTLLPECFGLEPNKETSFLALQLADGLNHYRDTVSVLLVCNQNRSIVRQIETALRSVGTPQIGQFKVLPGYAFESDQEVGGFYDVLLTTDQETLMAHPDFHHIPCILTYGDVQQLDIYMKHMAEHKRNKRQIDILEKFYRPKTHKGGNATLEDIIGVANGCDQSCQTIGARKLYVCRTGHNLPEQIMVYDLDSPIIYDHKKIRRIIYTSFPEGQQNILNFFTTVSDFLSEELESASL
jgi:lichenan operon transcriptional antiterminator